MSTDPQRENPKLYQGMFKEPGSEVTPQKGLPDFDETDEAEYNKQLSKKQTYKAQLIENRLGIQSGSFIEDVQYISRDGMIVLQEAALENDAEVVTYKGKITENEIGAMLNVAEQRLGPEAALTGSDKFKDAVISMVKDRQPDFERILDEDTGEVLYQSESVQTREASETMDEPSTEATDSEESDFLETLQNRHEDSMEEMEERVEQSFEQEQTQ